MVEATIEDFAITGIVMLVYFDDFLTKNRVKRILLKPKTAKDVKIDP